MVSKATAKFIPPIPSLPPRSSSRTPQPSTQKHKTTNPTRHLSRPYLSNSNIHLDPKITTSQRPPPRIRKPHLQLTQEQSGISYKLPRLDSDDIPLIPKDLATLFPLSLFRCKCQTRDLTDWERGFWRIDMSSWQEDDKLDFWTN